MSRAGISGGDQFSNGIDILGVFRYSSVTRRTSESQNGKTIQKDGSSRSQQKTMTDIGKVGAPNPALINRPIPQSKTDAAKTDTKDGAGDVARTAATFRLPSALSAGQTGPASAEDSLRTILDGLKARFAGVDEKPPANGGALEDLLSDIKVAAPILDRVLAARKDELIGDADGLAALDSVLAEAGAAVSDARAVLEGLSGGLSDEAEIEDPALAGALNAVLGEGREIPAFSADDIRAGRQEFIALVFDDIADALSRHRGTGTLAPSFTLSTLGGANLTA